MSLPLARSWRLADLVYSLKLILGLPSAPPPKALTQAPGELLQASRGRLSLSRKLRRLYPGNNSANKASVLFVPRGPTPGVWCSEM